MSATASVKQGLVLLLSFILIVLPVAGQTPRIDSLRRVLRVQPRPDTLRVRRLLTLMQLLRTKDATQATELGQQALGLAQRLGDSRGEGQALLDLSVVYRKQTDYRQARRYAQQARQLFSRLADQRGLGRAWLLLSTIDMLQGNPVPAMNAALRGLPLAEQAGDAQTQNRLKVVVGNCYYTMGNWHQALPLFKAVLRSGERRGDKQVVLQALNGLGNSFQKLKDWPQALHYHQRSLQLSQELGNVSGEIADETNLADVYAEQGNHIEALAHGRRARQLVQATHDNYNLPSVELMLARQFLLTGQLDSALALAHHCLELSQELRSNDNIRNASDILAQAYAQRGNFKRAYEYRNLHMAYNDTLAGKDIQLKTAELRNRYELEKKQAQIDLLTKTRQLQAQTAARQRQQLYGLLAGLGGLLLVAALLLRNIWLKQRANRQLEEKSQQVAAHRDSLSRTLNVLQDTQTQLVQREKMASLGELTAGVAHEIQNPLNFVTNFADLSVELVAELEEELAREPLSADGRQAVSQLLEELTQNQTKIHEHGHRADGIVKRMLEHSRSSTGQRQATDLNALAAEYLRLAYQGWRAKNKEFNATLTTDFDPELPPLSVVPQDLSRVLLNLLTNAFYAVAEKSRQAGPDYRPEVSVRTRRRGPLVQLSVRDNGLGIPAEVREKIFQPFFTTKPTGEGTGLGLSLSYDIITKGHGGTLDVESQAGEYTQFTIGLPLSPEPGRPPA